MPESYIVVRDLVKEYGDLQAVAGISFDIHAGEVFSILGPNGAGKTTTVEILECLRKPTSGSVEVLGYDIHRQSRDIAKEIGVLPQRFDAFDLLTVKENIEYFAGMFEDNVDVDELIEIVALEDKRTEYFKNLSGGLKQRVGVAISLVNDPKIVFLDEPTTGLDPRARREVWEVIKDLRKRGKTVILTSHYMEEAEVLSDRVAIMNRGEFIVLGSPDGIISEHGTGTNCIIKNGGQAVQELFSENGIQSTLKEQDVLVSLDGRENLAELVILLEAKGAYYSEILLQRSNLEDVFLSLTGKKIVEGELIDEE